MFQRTLDCVQVSKYLNKFLFLIQCFYSSVLTDKLVGKNPFGSHFLWYVSQAYFDVFTIAVLINFRIDQYTLLNRKTKIKIK